MKNLARRGKFRTGAICSLEQFKASKGWGGGTEGRTEGRREGRRKGRREWEIW